jgi:hypothetical protein
LCVRRQNDRCLNAFLCSLKAEKGEAGFSDLHCENIIELSVCLCVYTGAANKL